MLLTARDRSEGEVDMPTTDRAAHLQSRHLAVHQTEADKEEGDFADRLVRIVNEITVQRCPPDFPSPFMMPRVKMQSLNSVAENSQ